MGLYRVGVEDVLDRVAPVISCCSANEAGPVHANAGRQQSAAGRNWVRFVKFKLRFVKLKLACRDETLTQRSRRGLRVSGTCITIKPFGDAPAASSPRFAADPFFSAKEACALVARTRK